jgi:hydroxyacylglutathione hydrolase
MVPIGRLVTGARHGRRALVADTRASIFFKRSQHRHVAGWIMAGMLQSSPNKNRTGPMTAQTKQFLCLKDNYGVLVHDPATGATAAIDAPEAAPVEAALAATGWKLTDILVTHHHGDHTAGIAELKRHHHCRVVAPRREADKIPDVDVEVGEGDTVKVGSLTAQVIETPGHTLGQINYFFPADKLLFAGDTLFSIGCGRVIEGKPEQMWQSLLKLRALPDDTAVYCGHEYTDANIRFALTIEPGNAALQARAAEVKKQIAAGTPTVPSKLGEEKRANVFLRADDPSVAAAVGLAGKPAAQVFTEVRERKNRF